MDIIQIHNLGYVQKNNKKGSAMVFALILIANSLVILSSIVFISSIQFKLAGAISLTPIAFQRADSGLEYILWEINKGGAIKVEDACDVFDGTSRVCIINNPESTAFFLDEDDNVLSGNTNISDVSFVKVVGRAENGSAEVSRSLRASIFATP